MRITLDLPSVLAKKANPGSPRFDNFGWSAPVTFPRSSNIDSARYNVTHGTLEVRFRDGGSYTYQGVPVSVYEAFVQAPSAGRFFHAQIKNRYPTNRA